MKRVVAVLALALVFVVGAVAGAQATADELVARAKVKYDAEDTDGCIADCNKAIELDPKNTEAYCTRALAKVGGGDLDGALADCNKAVELKPRDSAAYSSRAFARYSKVDLDGSLADCDKAIELDPTFSEAWKVRASTHYLMRSWERALADWRKNCELDPGSQFLSRVFVWLTRSRMGQRLEADQELRDYAQGLAAPVKDSEKRSRALLSFLLGERSEDQFLRDYEFKDDAANQRGAARSSFYAGSKRLLDGDKKMARAYFEKCVELAPKTWLEYQLAQAELAGNK